MPDFMELEKRFIGFRDRLEDYRKLCVIIVGDHDDLDIDKICEEERELRNSLSCEYGELQADIHGMAGYNMVIWAGRNIDIFLSALDPKMERGNLIKAYCLEAALQCINKAIGSCKHAKQVARTDKQIIISKGARLQGLVELRNILSRAKKQLCIQDRYINADIFDFADELKDEVVIKIITQKEPYKGKPLLRTFYGEYGANRNNLQIRDCQQNEFHSRKILIDEAEGYMADFSLKDVGKNESYLNILSKPMLDEAINEFAKLWGKSSPLEVE